MINELLDWAVENFGSVEFDHRTTKEGDYTFIVKEGPKEYHVPVSDRTGPKDFLFYMKSQDLRDLESEIKSLPHKKNVLLQHIKQVKSEMMKLMR